MASPANPDPLAFARLADKAANQLASPGVPATAWEQVSGVDRPGLYSWGVDPPGAHQLSEGFRVSLAAGLIYIGQAGATRWPSGQRTSATLRTRISRQHLRGRIRGSTFRLTLASALAGALDFGPVAGARLSTWQEQALSDWMSRHLSLAVYPVADPDCLVQLEHRVLGLLDPALNLSGMPLTDTRAAITRARAALAAWSTPARQPITQPGGAMPDPNPASQVTLHDELTAILVEAGGGPLTTSALAAAVNARARYRKRDGSAVSAYQVHGRTTKYSHLFVREGSKVSLRPSARP